MEYYQNVWRLLLINNILHLHGHITFDSFMIYNKIFNAQFEYLYFPRCISIIRIKRVVRRWKQRSGSSVGAVGEAAEQQRKVEPLSTLTDAKNNLQTSSF